MGNEWYTPAKYIAAARQVMGGIDLDPASCQLANETVGATRFYTAEENGLAQEWNGRVWLNPPYGRVNPVPGCSITYPQHFVKKLLAEYDSGRVEQAILLVLGNACFNRYFRQLWNYPVCFHSGNIDFYRPDGTFAHFGFGSTFVYLGPREDKFIDVFSQFGTIVRRVEVVA